MNQSNVMQDLKEARQLESLIKEKTGYKTKVYIMKTDDEGGKEYQVHVSADDKTWKFTNVPFEDVDEAFYEFMFALLQRPANFTAYSVGRYGLLLKDALNAHELGDIGYNISHGNLMYLDESRDCIEPVTLCACKDITKMTVETNSDGELVEIVVITNNKRIVITDDGYKID